VRALETIVGPCRGIRVQQLVADADDCSVHAAGTLEDVHLPAADDGEGPGLDDGRVAVDQLPAGAGTGPDQLVVVVAVRTPGPSRRRRSEACAVEQHDLQGGILAGQPIDREVVRALLLPAHAPPLMPARRIGSVL
jgi:hypothetical protein